MDWKDSLKSFLDNNPDLPAGSEPTPEPEAPKRRPRLEIVYEKKGRRGKPCTIIAGFTPDNDIKAIASKLKTTLGVGGSADGDEILLQGDQRKALPALLKKLGY